MPATAEGLCVYLVRASKFYILTTTYEVSPSCHFIFTGDKQMHKEIIPSHMLSELQDL